MKTFLLPTLSSFVSSAGFLRLGGLVALAASLSLGGCSCDGDPDPDPPSSTPVGTLRVVHSDDANTSTATLVVTGLRQPLRMFQVDVTVDGGSASAIAPVLTHDLVEAGLTDGARASFTAVVADTSRTPINNGNIATITLDAGARATLKSAVAVDSNGARQTLAVEGSE